MTHQPISLIAKLVFVLGAGTLLWSENVRALYLVSATPTSKRSYGYASHLLTLDPGRAELIPIRRLQEAVDFVLEYKEGGLLAVGALGGGTAEIIDERNPATGWPATLADPIVVDNFFLVLEGRLHYGAITAPKRLEAPARLVTRKIDHLSGVAEEIESERSLRRYYVGDGLHGGFGDAQSTQHAWFDGNVVEWERTRVPWKPPNWGGQGLIAFHASTASYLIASREDSADVVKSGEWGESVAWIMDRTTNAWVAWRVPGTKLWPRVFRDWVTMNVTRIDATRTDSLVSLPKDEQGRPDIRALDPTIRHSGTLLLRNFKTGESHRIETKENDCEVLLIEGRTVFYRANDAILEGELNPRQEVVEGRVVIRGAEVPGIHWAFYGRAKQGK